MLIDLISSIAKEYPGLASTLGSIGSTASIASIASIATIMMLYYQFSNRRDAKKKDEIDKFIKDIQVPKGRKVYIDEITPGSWYKNALKVYESILNRLLYCFSCIYGVRKFSETSFARSILFAYLYPIGLGTIIWLFTGMNTLQIPDMLPDGTEPTYRINLFRGCTRLSY